MIGFQQSSLYTAAHDVVMDSHPHAWQWSAIVIAFAATVSGDVDARCGGMVDAVPRCANVTHAALASCVDGQLFRCVMYTTVLGTARARSCDRGSHNSATGKRWMPKHRRFSVLFTCMHSTLNCAGFLKVIRSELPNHFFFFCVSAAPCMFADHHHSLSMPLHAITEHPSLVRMHGS